MAFTSAGLKNLHIENALFVGDSVPLGIIGGRNLIGFSATDNVGAIVAGAGLMALFVSFTGGTAYEREQLTSQFTGGGDIVGVYINCSGAIVNSNDIVINFTPASNLISMQFLWLR